MQDGRDTKTFVLELSISLFKMNQLSIISSIQTQNKKAPDHNRRDESFFFKPAIQPKLIINQPNDIYEQEADAMADKVMRSSAQKSTQGLFFKPASFIQRQRAHCGEEEKLQMKSDGQNDNAITVPPLVNDVINSVGQPLETGTKNFMKERFGYDFGSVQIHNDSSAHQSAAAINALAYTHGDHIVFNEGRYEPGSNSGKHLLSHELTHVVQQSGNTPVQKLIQRDPDPTPKAPANPESLAMRPRYQLELANPFTDVKANASAYDLGSAALGFGFEKLVEKYPYLGQHWYMRVAEMALSSAPLITGMTYSHEMGHYRVAKKYGWDPSIELKAPWSGVTHYPNRPLNTPVEEKLEASEAGVNQEQFNAATTFSRMARSGNVNYQEAAAYFLTQTNLFFYTARTKYLVLTSKPDTDDDLDSYTTKTGHSLNKLLVMSALTNLLSYPLLNTFYNSIAYLWTGSRKVKVPTFGAFGQQFTFPHFQMLLTTQGPILGNRIILNPTGKLPLEFTFDVQLGATNDVEGVALGAKLHDLTLGTPKLHISPFLRATVADSAGIFGGADIRYDLTPWVGITGTLGFRKNDLLNEAEGKEDGFEGNAALTFSFGK